VDQVTHADLALEIGSLAEMVEVSAVATVLESDKSTLSHVVDSRLISNMPLNARQFLDLALLTPGVLPAAKEHRVEASMSQVRGPNPISFLWMASAISIRRSTRL